MNNRNLIFWLTFLLLAISIFLVDDIVDPLLVPLVIIYAAGWVFSWFMKNRNMLWVARGINIGGLFVLVWAFYSIANNYFFYEGIVRIIIMAIVLYEALLSLNAYSLKRRDSIQFFTLPLFIVSIIFPPHYPHPIWPTILILLYIFVGFMIIRLRFQINLGEQRVRSGLAIYLTLILILLLSIIAAKIVVVKMAAAPGRLKFSLYPSLTKSTITDEKYYYLQSKLLDEFTESGAKKTKEESRNIFLLSSLVKDSAIVEEAAAAKKGLISYLGQPGLGISDNQISGMLLTLNTYIKAKSQRQMAALSGQITEALRKNTFPVTAKAKISIDVNRIIHSESHRHIEDIQDGINTSVDNSLVEGTVKEDLKKDVEELKNWKLLDLYDEKIRALRQIIWSVKINEDLRKEMIELLKELQDFPESYELEELKEDLNEIEDHKEATNKTEAMLIAEYKDLIEIYSSLVKESGSRKALEKKKEQLKELTRKRVLKSIEVSPSYKELISGQNLKLKAMGKFSDGYEEEITLLTDWQTDNDQAVSVSKGGVAAKSEGEARVLAQLQEVESNPVFITVIKSEIYSLVAVPDNPKLVMGKTAKIEVRGYYTDFHYKNLTYLVSWQVPDKRNITIEKNIIKGHKPGRNIIYAEYKGLKSKPIRVVVTPTLPIVLKRMALAILVMLLIIVLLLVIDQVRKKRKLTDLFYDDPRGFVIHLYDSARIILGIFRLPYQNNPFMEYAKVVDETTASGTNTFLNLTKRFTQAQYSSGKLTGEDAVSALKEYNEMLMALKDTQNILSRSVKYLIILFCRIPFFITIKIA